VNLKVVDGSNQVEPQGESAAFIAVTTCQNVQALERTNDMLNANA
jgi:hypothetical protein